MNNPLTDGKRIKLGYDYFAKGFSDLQLSDAYYRLIAEKRQERLLYETATMDQVDEVYNPEDAGNENDRMTTEEMVLEAIRVQRFARTDTKMAALVRVFNSHLKDKNIEAMAPIIGTPKKSGLFATVTVQIPFSDGQVVSIIFHSPDNNKMKIAADDEIIAFRWLLNKRDITHVVSPENDAEVSLQEIGKRTAQLVEKNSTRFQVKQKELVEQRKNLEELKSRAEEAAKHHDELMATLKEGQDAEEMMNVKVANLRERIEKQKAFNDDLQGKIDALIAKQAGNDGKAAGGDTPKTEADVKAEQEKTELEAKKAAFEQELTGRGFEAKRSAFIFGNEAAEHVFVSAITYEDRAYKIGVRYYDNSLAEKKPAEKVFSSATIAGLDKQTTKVLDWIDKKLKVMKSAIDPAVSALDATVGFAEFLTRQDKGHNEGYSPKKSVLNIDGVAKSEGLDAKWTDGEDEGMPIAVGTFTMAGGNQVGGAQISPDGKAIFLLNGERYRGDYYFATADDETQEVVMKEIAGIIREAKEKGERETQVDETNRLIEVGKTAVPGIRLQDAEEAGKLWEMKERGEFSQEDWDKYTADLAASNKIASTESKPGPTEPSAAVGMLNDILAGKYDYDSTKLGEVLDQAAAELEREGKAEEYDSLLNQAADYLTELLKKEAA